MDSRNCVREKYITDVIFIKEIIKTLEDSIYDSVPDKCHDILPLLHKSYDNMALILYRLNK